MNRSFLLLGLLLATHYPARPVAAYPSDVRCDGLQILPLAPAYAPGQTVSLELKGSTASGPVTALAAYYASATSDLTQSASWTAVPGTFNAASQSFTASFSMPAQAGTYILVANVTNAADETCGGNPGYDCCPGGITVGGGYTVASKKPCLGCQRSFVVGPVAPHPVGCSAITIAPGKDVYGPQETIQIGVQGAALDGSVTGIEVFFAKADADLKNATAWTKLPGSFAGSNWSATLNTSTHFADVIDTNTGGYKMNGGEFILAAVVTSSSGKQCSSNSGYAAAACPLGIAMGGGISLSDKIPCNGCPRVIVVDPLKGGSNPVDSKAYWNLTPGNAWHYSGTNFALSPAQTFEARVELEAPALVCGLPTMPMRFIKSNVAGYWGPAEPPPSTWQGIRNLRFFTTGFLGQNRWDGSYLGTVGHKSYKTSFTGSGTPPWYTLGTFYSATDPNVQSWDHMIYTAPWEQRHFPPYLLSAGPATSDWFFHREDAAFGRGHDEAQYCKDTAPDLDVVRGTHGWKAEYAVVSRSFAAAGLGTVQALRVKYVEYGVPYCKGWVLREDYYLVQDVGLAEIDVKRFDGLSGGCSDPDLGATTLSSPAVKMTLVGFFDGKSMALQANPSSVTPGGAVTITLPNHYTGRIQREQLITTTGATQTIVDDWQGIWIQGGVVTYTAPSDANLVSVRLRLRPPIPANPSAHEELMGPAETLWSQPLLLTVVSPPTDGSAGDGPVSDAAVGDGPAARDSAARDSAAHDGSMETSAADGTPLRDRTASEGAVGGLTGGCGCHLGGVGASTGGLGLLLLLALVVAVLQRRR